MPLARLEPCGSKDPRTVLRGLGAGNRVRLPDTNVWELAKRRPARFLSEPAEFHVAALSLRAVGQCGSEVAASVTADGRLLPYKH